MFANRFLIYFHFLNSYFYSHGSKITSKSTLPDLTTVPSFFAINGIINVFVFGLTASI